ncbi:DNA binding protein [Salinispirillum sp. LH 10-3-1]|uniref:DNA binding protein n=1 Tax=Salinispirillum sp. LH 10-3-1 TaxID=2952525 RepID=A0AB38YCM8_9GAMM
MFVQDIDKQIEDYKARIEALEAERKAQAKKIEGFDAFEAAIQKVSAEFHVSREELYLSKGDELLEWVKSLSKHSNRPEVYNDLKSYFARVIAREGTASKKPAAKSTGPKLEVGSYRNPHSGETVEKIKRNPRELDSWISEYGLDTVQSWKL